MPPTWTKTGFQRRAIGWHGYRLDGIADVLLRMQDASVLDIAANRGMISYELALNGATVCHGVDEYEKGMMVANEVFADLRTVDAKFAVCDLRGGIAAIAAALGDDFRDQYDVVVYMATHHKLQRIMQVTDLLALVRGLGLRCGGYFLWRGSVQEYEQIDPVLKETGLRMVQWSELTPDDAPSALWRRN